MTLLKLINDNEVNTLQALLMDGYLNAPNADMRNFCVRLADRMGRPFSDSEAREEEYDGAGNSSH